MNEIINILMNRDRISYNEAHNIVDDCLEELRDCIYHGCSYDECVDIVQGWLGLEPDYLDVLMEDI